MQERYGLSAESKLLTTIWSLANQETFPQTGNRLGVSWGYAHYLFKQDCSAIATLASNRNVTRWPSKDDNEQLVQNYAFPGRFAAIDGSHIAIKTLVTCGELCEPQVICFHCASGSLHKGSSIY